MPKLLVGIAAAVVLAATLMALTWRARAEGRLSYCRNNLRHLGELAHAQFAANYESIPTQGGRAFWQAIRDFRYFDSRNKSWRREPLNPFGCPVRGVSPLDLASLSPEDLAKYMSDPSTIDYRGPSSFPEEPSKVVLGADRDGNHRSGGHVLLADFSILKTSEALDLTTEWSRASATRD